MEVNEEFYDILEAASQATSKLLPAKSREKYEKCYALFCQWRTRKRVQGVDENIILAYFFEKVSLIKKYYHFFNTDFLCIVTGQYSKSLNIVVNLFYAEKYRKYR